MSVEERRIAVQEGVELYGRVWEGSGTDVPFLLVHGLSSNARLWDGVGNRLAGFGHRVVAIDQRGHGLSSKPDGGYDFATLADDLVAVARQTGLDRPVIAGQSWGANLALDLAIRHADRVCGVVAIDGATGNMADRFPTWEECAAALAPPELAGTPLERMREGMRRRHPDWPSSGIAGALACFEVRADGTVAPWLTRERHMRILRELWAHRPTDLYPRLAVNALLVPCAPPGAANRAGDRAKAKRTAVDRVAAGNPRVRVRWFEADHDVHAQKPDEVARLLHDTVVDGFLT